MNKDEIDFFMKNGYFILKNAISKDFCEKVVNNSKEVFKESLGNDYHKKFYHIKYANYNNHLKNLKNNHNFKYNFLKEHNNILNQVANTNTNYNIPGGGCIGSFKTDNNEVNWHIDGWEHHWLSQPLHTTCVIAYTDTNQGTWVAPESIKIITELFYKHNFMFHAETLMEFSPLTQYIINKCKDIRQIPLKQGDMLVMHPFLLHAANNNKTQDIRSVCNYHLYKEIDFKNPISLVEKKMNQDLLELKLDPNLYKLDTSKNLPKYDPLVIRTCHDKEYDLLKKQLIYLQKNNIEISKNYKNVMKNNFNKNNNKDLDDYNKNIYNIKKNLFSLRPNNQ